ncbi:CpaF family protein [Frankia sp. CNm7]|uniref:CpaF family protein n=2 Tax=Frankia nepalensis TaxID=1836974 RepID=A0A937UTM4_9ACTN|nr:CpaF family protein [Frankia nepalensis]MBL7509136.1 CpaF family protein [Frankia nepalensis]MBL7521718.1 CpaF family protein [Frankia nepalensis]MBL7630181.1 CpaF family protein [Frankia nepalensis]
MPVRAAERGALVEETITAVLVAARQQAAAEGRPALLPTVEDVIRRRARAARAELGPLGPALTAAHRWSDVEVNGAVNMICTDRTSGQRVESPSPFASDEEVWEWAAGHAALAGRRFDEANPSVRFRLPNGVRVHAVGRVTSLTHLDCRLFTPALDTLMGLAGTGMCGPDLVALLAATAALQVPFGLVISGGTGAGKTTLLRAWANATPTDRALERVVVVEDEAELFLDRTRWRNLVEFEAREANVDGRGEYPMERYLTADLRRQTPGRVLLGELKPDGGVLPLLLAAGQGIAHGVATTVHAPSAADVIGRLRTYAAISSRTVPETVVLETIAATVDLVVHVAQHPAGRVVTSIREIGEYRAGSVSSAELWRWHPRAARAVRTEVDLSEQLTAKLATVTDPDQFRPRRSAPTGGAW